MAPVRANMASRSVVLPLWKGPTSAMHRGPRGLLTSCPIAASLHGARPLIGSAGIMHLLRRHFGKLEKRRCAGKFARERKPVLADRRSSKKSKRHALHSWPKFQALQAGRNVEPDLPLQAKGLKREGVCRAADQHIAPHSDADRRA